MFFHVLFLHMFFFAYVFFRICFFFAYVFGSHVFFFIFHFGYIKKHMQKEFMQKQHMQKKTYVKIVGGSHRPAVYQKRQLSITKIKHM